MASRMLMFFNIADHRQGHLIISPPNLVAVQAANKAAAAAIETRKKTILLTRATASEVDQVIKHKTNTSIAGRSLSIIGSVVGCVAGGIVTVVTAGAAAAPILGLVLMGCGTGVGVAGGITKGVGGYVCSSKQNNLLEDLRQTIEEDEEAHSRLEELMKTFRNPEYNETEFAVHMGGLTAGFAVSNTVAHVKGGMALITLLSIGLPKLSTYFQDKNIQKLLGSATLLVPLLIKGLETTVKTGVNIADDIAVKAVGGMVEGPTKKWAFEAAKNAAQTVILEGGDDAVSAAAEAAASVAAKEATQNVVKVMARVTGGFTIGLGFLMVAWDSYGLYEDCKNRKKESLGDAMRRMAKSLEDVGSSPPELSTQLAYCKACSLVIDA